MNFPDPDQAIAMPTEELAGYLVMQHKGQKSFSVHNVMCGINSPSQSSSLPNPIGNDREKREQYKEAIIEAYGWGFSEGLFILDPDRADGGNWWRVSRRGRKLDTPFDAVNLASRDILPKAFLHPMIVEHAAPMFHMGKYDAAVFQAFKQVEIAVRDASGLALDGSKLMKGAFNSSNGPLNTAEDPSEKEGLMFVFAGAIQLFRNSTGHKNLDIDPQEAAHLLIHASYLMSLLEKHVQAARGKGL